MLTVNDRLSELMNDRCLELATMNQPVCWKVCVVFLLVLDLVSVQINLQYSDCVLNVCRQHIPTL